MRNNGTLQERGDLTAVLPPIDTLDTGRAQNPVSIRIYDALARSIRGGRFSAGARLPTARDLSEHYGVGVATIGRVLTRLEEQGLVTTRVGSGTFVAHSRRSSVQLDVYLCIHPAFMVNQEHELAFERLQGIISAAQVRGVSLHPVTTAQNLDMAESADRRVGILLFDDNYEADGFGAIARQAVERRLPVCIAGFSNTDLPGSNAGHEEAFYLAAEHLLALGHRRIGLLNYCGDLPESNPLPSQNRSGYLKAFRRRRLSPPPDLYIEAVSEASARFDEETKAALDQLLDRRPALTALICNNDVRACRALELLAGRGIRVPQDVSVVGFDNRKRSAVSSPPLTTVDPLRFRQGEAALNHVADWLRHGKAVLDPIRPRLIVRKSTIPVSSE